ncbi:MAG: YSC84-related protein [Desulfobacterales bacterium]
MKTKRFKTPGKLSNAFYLSVFIILVFSIGLTAMVYAAAAKEIDASADEVMDRFYKQVKDAKEFVRKAKALLIMPNVVKAGLLIGGEYGRGALRINGKTVDYYNVVSGSFGAQIGAEAKDWVIVFMTDEALKKFRESKGWEAGVDGNVALITVGGGDSGSTRNAKGDIIGFVFDVKGLMADVSFKGAKFTKLDMSK